MRGVRKKAIAAFEFLLVYGIVMVIIAAVFVTLSTFNVQSPQAYAQESCTSYSLGCLEVIPNTGKNNPGDTPQAAGILFVVSNADSATMLLQDVETPFVEISGAACNNPQVQVYVDNDGNGCGWKSLTGDNRPIEDVRLESGREMALRIRCAEFANAASSKVSGQVQVEYIPQGRYFKRVANVEFRNYEIIEGIYDVQSASCPTK